MPSKMVNDVGSLWVIPQEYIGRFDLLEDPDSFF